MKYIIRMVPEREWYVCKYMLPEMHKQGIDFDDIFVYTDTEHKGCLDSFKTVCEMCNYDSGAWYLQDDIIFSHDFKVVTERFIKPVGYYDVVCGFCSCYDEHPRHMGELDNLYDMWYSFPCIYISNEYSKEFLAWLERNEKVYLAWTETGKHDDLLFRSFVLNRPRARVYNLMPNIVDHVDKYVGGSIVNPTRKEKDVKSLYFNEDRRKQEIEKICRLLPNG